MENANEIHVFTRRGRNKYASREHGPTLVLTLASGAHLAVRECDLMDLIESKTNEEAKLELKYLVRQWFLENEDKVFIRQEDRKEDTDEKTDSCCSAAECACGGLCKGSGTDS